MLTGIVMQSIFLQSGLAVAMFLTTAVAGFLPLKILKMLTKKDGSQSKSGERWLSLLSCFSGGVFLATCFLDIMPHINENYASFLEQSGWDPEIPFPQFCICIGFFMVYLIEELCIKIFAMPHDHGPAVPPKDSSVHPRQDIRRPSARRFSETSNVMANGHSSLEVEEPMLGESGRKKSMLSLHDIVMEESVKYVADDNNETSFLKSLTFAVAMSFHSILEGFALGVQDTPKRIFTLFLSLILHKGIEAFSVGLQISRGNSKRIKVVICTIIIYALMTPIGSAIGTALQTSSIDPLHKEGAVVILESLAAGTFIYVTFLEVLAHEKENDQDSLKQLLAIFIGFAVITILQFVFGGHGGGEHDHDHHVTPGH